jgi:HSP20 family protein
MQVNQTLSEVKDLYRKVTGKPAPKIEPVSYVPFPPGVDPVKHAVAEVQQMKELTDWMALAPGPTAWAPRADSFLTEDTYVVEVEIPGVGREDLKVFVTGGECVVRGERKTPAGTADRRLLSIERPWGTFERRFVLPAGCDGDAVHARYHEGVLELRVPLKQGGIPKETKVEVA